MSPGVRIEEIPGERSIEAVGTSTAAFVGVAPRADAHLNEAYAVNNWSHFVKEYVPAENVASTPLSHAVAGFFQNGGGRCYVVNIAAGDAIAGMEKPRRTGLKLLEEIDDVSIVAAPGYSDITSHEALQIHAEKMGNCFVILDPPPVVPDVDQLKTVEAAPVPPPTTGKKGAATSGDGEGGSAPAPAPPPGLRPRVSKDGRAAIYYPDLVIADPLSAKGDLVQTSPSGFIAGVYARTDRERGVHKAPANVSLRGVLNLTYRVTDEEQADLNSAGINVIRFFRRDGVLVWGARTLAEESSEWRYVNVRRLAIMLEESVLRATTWAVFEPNGLGLWKMLRFEISNFLLRVWRDGALRGATPDEAFFVKCDAETNPPEVVDAGQVVVVVGFAPSKPAEFVIIRFAQHTRGGSAEVM
jgi:phage tail sheath protein FI